MPDEQIAGALEALARYVRAARQAAGMPIEGPRGAAEAGNMSPVTWRKVEDGLPVRELTYASVERVLGWQQGSIEAILAGGEPTPRKPRRSPKSEAEIGMDQVDVAMDQEGLTDTQRLDLIRGILYRYKQQLARKADRTDDDQEDRSEAG